MKSIAIIDDHQVLAECLALALRAEPAGHTVSVVSPNDGDPLAALDGGWPDLCLLDLDFGSKRAEGLDLIPTLVDHGVTTVVFTGSEDHPTLGRCLELGAVGIISKTVAFDAVVERISIALAGGDVNPQAELYSWLLAATRSRSERERLSRPFDRLTAREAEILAALVDGLRADDISERDCVSVRTVRTQVRSIFQKLEVSSQLAAVALARRSGWSAPKSAADRQEQGVS